MRLTRLPALLAAAFMFSLPMAALADQATAPSSAPAQTPVQSPAKEPTSDQDSTATAPTSDEEQYAAREAGRSEERRVGKECV